MRVPRRVATLRGMGMRCLIVDDSDEFIGSARGLLASQGVDVLATASSSAEAQRLAELHRPDVALVDVQLRNESGLDLARRLSADVPATKVILISSYAAEDFADLIAESPAVGFLPKSALSAEAIRELASAPRGT